MAQKLSVKDVKVLLRLSSARNTIQLDEQIQFKRFKFTVVDLFNDNVANRVFTIDFSRYDQNRDQTDTSGNTHVRYTFGLAIHDVLEWVHHENRDTDYWDWSTNNLNREESVNRITLDLFMDGVPWTPTKPVVAEIMFEE